MIALWIVLAVIVVALAALAVAGRVRTRRRGAAPEPSARTRPAPTAPTAPAPPGAPPKPPAPAARPAEAAPAGTPPAGAPTGTAAPGAAPAPEAPPAPPVEAPAAPPSFRERLGKARGVFSGLRAVRGRASVDAATWDELEETLIRADVGVATTDTLLADLRRRVQAKELSGGADLLEALRADLVDLLDVSQRWDAADAETGVPGGGGVGSPAEAEAADGLAAPVSRQLRFDGDPDAVDVWLFVGVNGVGKTTTVGKLARQQAAAGRSVLLAAGDTFRAAAGEQLALWADRSGVDVVRGAEGGDPSAVVFDAVQRAAARGNRLVLADTAGRLHTKVNLVEELKKIRRVADRPPGRVTEVLLVLDATTGQNGLVQAKEFTDAVEVTGVVLTKLDGSAKGGVVVAIQRELGLPVKLVGLGEGPDDLVPFDPEQFVDALLG
ncbi:MAG TPA: signal recognition particle-docking protein FtsY [Acidimicrobiales bacterium]|nr:signal recognition particle-docking protein FtsY [Acidimicrobiales bacterium]